jgi:hypothetical protein
MLSSLIAVEEENRLVHDVPIIAAQRYLSIDLEIFVWAIFLTKSAGTLSLLPILYPFFIHPFQTRLIPGATMIPG